MTIKIVMIGAIVMIILISSISNVSASARELTQDERESGFYNERGSPKYDQDRPAINPDFAPDEECNLGYYLKCLPGTAQECPEGYHNGEDNSCSPVECQEGYHEEEDNESGLCYPDSEGCPEGSEYALVERDDGKGIICLYLFRICNEAEHSSKDYCIEYCEENSRGFTCKPDAS
jgi:hypothetical protein